MSTLARLIADRTDLTPIERHHLARLVEEWSVIADLALSDLVLWVPMWNDAGFVAVAQVRPTTAPTVVPDDMIGRFEPRGRMPLVDQALAYARAVRLRDSSTGWMPGAVEAYPVSGEARVIGILARHASAAPRVAGRLEEIYLESADDLLAMVVSGSYPSTDPVDDAGDPPRVGDGLIRLTATGTVDYASPNAINAMRRLGLARDLVGSALAEVAVKLVHRPGPVDSLVSSVASGRTGGVVELDNATAAVRIHGLPLVRAGERVGALVFCRDVTDLRRREQALLGKDATIREIHHRVKNNLQTVAAMLRLQARRASVPEAREALVEAELRVAAIAVVHESLSGDVGEAVDFDGIIDRILALVRDLAPGHVGDRELPVLQRTGSWGSLTSDAAIPLAMSVSELVHNAVEHGSPRTVDVRLTREGPDLVMEVHDDGVGLPDGFDWDSTGLGLSIVRSLVTADLHGHCEVVDDPQRGGTTIRIRVGT